MLDWSLVNKLGPTECWEWLGGINSDGYGYYKKQRVNRLILQEKIGRPLEGFALHSCGNRSCCNPYHLKEGTHQDNMDDMSLHGTHDGKNRRGECHPRSKLSDEDRIIIRQSLERGTILAKRFNIAQSTVSMIRRGRRGKI